MLDATLYEVAHGAAWITLNRPENRNALSATLPAGTAFAEMARLSASMFVSPEGQEGMATFREKRAPAWVRMEDQP